MRAKSFTRGTIENLVAEGLVDRIEDRLPRDVPQHRASTTDRGIGRKPRTLGRDRFAHGLRDYLPDAAQSGFVALRGVVAEELEDVVHAGPGFEE